MFQRANSVRSLTLKHLKPTIMKLQLTLAAFTLLMVQTAIAQCERTMLIVSPSFYKYAGHKLGVGAELGFLPVASKSFVTLKANLSTKEIAYQTSNYKGQTETYTNILNTAFVGLKLHYVPQAFESLPRKWEFGAAAGIYTETRSDNKPAMEFSSAYIIRMASGSYNGGVGYLKLEGLCQVRPNAVTAGVSVGVCLLL